MREANNEIVVYFFEIIHSYKTPYTDLDECFNYLQFRSHVYRNEMLQAIYQYLKQNQDQTLFHLESRAGRVETEAKETPIMVS